MLYTLVATKSLFGAVAMLYWRGAVEMTCDARSGLCNVRMSPKRVKVWEERAGEKPDQPAFLTPQLTANRSD